MTTKVKQLEDALRQYPSGIKVQVLVGCDKYYIESVYLEDERLNSFESMPYSSGKTVVVLKLEGNPL